MSSGQGKNWRGFGWGGIDPIGAVVDPIRKSAKIGMGSILDNLQLNNGLKHCNFFKFQIFGENMHPQLFRGVRIASGGN